MQILQKPSAAGAEPLLHRFIHDAIARQCGPQALIQEQAADVLIGAPHKVLNLRLDHLAAGHGRSHAALGGLRYFVRGKGGMLALAEVGLDYTGTQATEVKHISGGPHVQFAVDALAKASAHPHPEACELFLLRCAALNVSALLLEPPSGAPAVVFVAKPWPSYLTQPYYGEAAFFAALQPQAQQLLQSQQPGADPVDALLS